MVQLYLEELPSWSFPLTRTRMEALFESKFQEKVSWAYPTNAEKLPDFEEAWTQLLAVNFVEGFAFIARQENGETVLQMFNMQREWERSLIALDDHRKELQKLSQDGAAGPEFESSKGVALSPPSN